MSNTSEPAAGAHTGRPDDGRPRRRRWLRRIVVLILLLVVGGAAVGASWFRARYEVAPRMTIPIKEFSKFEYAEDPGNRSIHCGQYDGRRLVLVQQDDVHFDFVFEPLRDHIARIVIKDVDVGRMTPDVPEWTKDDPGLVRIALTDREWNRQQVQFAVPSPHVEVSGGNGFERDELSVVSLAKNCLNAGLWELILKVDGANGPESYYHGWFTFPLGQYKRLIERNTGFSYWDHWYKLEHWSDPAGTVVDLAKLRSVTADHVVDAVFDRHDQILVAGEQVRKKRTTNARNLVTWDDLLTRHDVEFATFRPPGYYDVATPWSNEYWRLATMAEVHVRDVQSSSGASLDEIEVVFEAENGESNRFLVGGIDLRALPALPVERYPEGLYMPMGIGVPPFYQSYPELLAADPQESPYYSFLLDDGDRWVDHHKAAIDGPVLHRDVNDPNLVHLYLLSYERHSLICHIRIPLPPRALARR